MTPRGHMFAGWPTFSAAQRDEQTVGETRVLMPASGPLFEVTLALGGHRAEYKFWSQTLGTWPLTSLSSPGSEGRRCASTTGARGHAGAASGGHRQFVVPAACWPHRDDGS